MRAKKKLSEYFENGGPHLGAVRRWIQRAFNNGSRVTWGSLDQLGGTGLTVRQMENLAEEIKDAVVRELEPVFQALRSENDYLKDEVANLKEQLSYASGSYG